MSKTIDISVENNGTDVIIVSLERVGVEAHVGNVERSITVDFGSLPQNIYWDEILDKPNFHPVATSGDYDDLENKPNLHAVATSGDYDDLENKPNLSGVATSGNYADLSGKPRINSVTLNGNKTSAQLGLATAAQAVPTGGTTGQVLTKHSNTDNDVEWADVQGELTFDSTPTSGSTNPVTSNGIYEALLEVPNTYIYTDITEIDSETLGELRNGDVVIERTRNSDNTYIVTSVSSRDVELTNVIGTTITTVVYTNGAYSEMQTADMSEKADKVTDAVATDFAIFDSYGNLEDSGYALGDFALADQAVPDGGTTGQVLAKASYNDNDVEWIDLQTAVSITYSELKTLRDGGDLVAGTLYRITDYTCTTVQENTQSAGHVFDILVYADDESHLNENAKAAHHQGDTYFAHCKLESWELKYCLDNDTSRFAWADDTNGKGVVYYMKDEWNNECPYDFKNIQFKRWAVEECENCPSLEVDNEYNIGEFYYGAKRLDGDNVLPPETTTYGEDFGWFYTFALKDLANDSWYDYTVEAHIGLNGDEGFEMACCDNHIAEATDEYASGNGAMAKMLNNIVFFNLYTDISDPSYADDYSYCNNNRFLGYCQSNTFGCNCYQNTFCNNFQGNTFGNIFFSNSFGEDCIYNTFGDNCSYNSFGNHCTWNTFRLTFSNNSLGDGCSSNSFGTNCGFNSLGNYCYHNSFGSDFRNNSLGNFCTYNTFGDYLLHITVFEGVTYCNVTGGDLRAYVRNAQILNGTTGTSQANKLTITFAADKNYTQVAGKKTDGTLRIWNISDIDTTPTSNSTNPITSGGVYTALQDKLDAPFTAGTSGQVLTSDGQGGQSWQTPSGGGTATDVQVNGTSITSNNVANIVTNTAYNASSNKIATMSDLPSVPVTDVTVGGTSVVSSGVAVIPAIPTVPNSVVNATSQQDGTVVLTMVNGDTITIDLNHTHPNYYKKVVETTQPSGGMLPDVVYELGTLTGATTFSFAAAVSGNVNHYYFTFTSGSTAVVPTWPASITSWDGNCVDSNTGLPVIAANKTYEVSVLDGNAIIKEW